MGNTISSSLMAMRTLNSLNKNIKRREKAAHHLSLGELIGSAGDATSNYSIGEKMKVRIRALGQDHNNVQNGMVLLHVAEGGIQNQINILRNIKRKVIEAANDTNTDSDRQTIQKEINQGFQQMDAIAADTEYNGIKVLHGIDKLETIKSWNYLSTADLLPYSDDMGIVPNVYETLDGKIGPFDVFTGISLSSSEIATLGLTGSYGYNEVSGTANTHTLDFSQITSVSQLEGACFEYRWESADDMRHISRYVFTSDTSKHWPAKVIDISGCTTVADVIGKMSAMTFEQRGTVTTTDHSVTIAMPHAGTKYNWVGYVPFGYAQPAVVVKDGALLTGLFSGEKFFSGGVDASTYTGQPDAQNQPAVQATLTLDISNVPDGSGVTFHNNSLSQPIDNSVTYETTNSVQIKFVDGNSLPYWNDSYTCLTVGKEASMSYYEPLDLGQSSLYIAKRSARDASFKVDAGKITFQANCGRHGAQGNSYSVTDGIATRNVTYEALTSFTDAGGTIENNQVGTDDDYEFDMDVSQYTNSTRMADMENIIADMVGKDFQYTTDRGTVHNAIFYDSAASPKMTSISNFSTETFGQSIHLDVNQIREDVRQGNTVADALVY